MTESLLRQQLQDPQEAYSPIAEISVVSAFHRRRLKVTVELRAGLWHFINTWVFAVFILLMKTYSSVCMVLSL